MPENIAGYFPYGMPDYRSEFPIQELDMPLLLYGGFSVQRDPILLSEHTHNGFEIHVIRSGAMPQITSTGEHLSGRGGEVVLVQPGVLHRGEDGIIPKSELLWFVIDPVRPQAKKHTPFTAKDLRQLNQRLRACGNCCRPAGEAVFAQYDACKKALQAFDQEPTKPEHTWDLRWSLNALISTVLQACEQGEQNGDVFSSATAQALAYMAAHLNAPITMEALAAEVGFSPSRFYAIFKQDTGLTPADHHLRMRISAARQNLIQFPERPIADISEEFGFVSARHFATVFKRFTGTRPTQTRNKAYPQ